MRRHLISFVQDKTRCPKIRKRTRPTGSPPIVWNHNQRFRITNGTGHLIPRGAAAVEPPRGGYPRPLEGLRASALRRGPGTIPCIAIKEKRNYSIRRIGWNSLYYDKLGKQFAYFSSYAKKSPLYFFQPTYAYFIPTGFFWSITGSRECAMSSWHRERDIEK